MITFIIQSSCYMLLKMHVHLLHHMKFTTCIMSKYSLYHINAYHQCTYYKEFMCASLECAAGAHVRESCMYHSDSFNLGMRSVSKNMHRSSFSHKYCVHNNIGNFMHAYKVTVTEGLLLQLLGPVTPVKPTQSPPQHSRIQREQVACDTSSTGAEDGFLLKAVKAVTRKSR